MTGTYKFGDIPQETLDNMFRDGRIASFFFEYQLVKWFPELTRVDAKGYDHVDSDGNKYDAKGFTKGGLNYAPSIMVGGGRKIDEAELHSHASNISYICVDIVKFPQIQVKFKKGNDMVSEYPKGHVPSNHRDALFG